MLSSVAGPELKCKKGLCELLGHSDLPIGQDRVAKLIEVFAMTDAELGVTNGASHQLDTGESAPIKQYSCHIPFLLCGPVEEAVNDMLQREKVGPSSSPWTSPIILVKKKGTYRLCINQRKLKAVTKTKVFPLSRIEDYLNALAGVQYFLILGLASGFLVHPNLIEKMAFVSHILVMG